MAIHLSGRARRRTYGDEVMKISREERLARQRERKRIWRMNNADREREISRRACRKYLRAKGIKPRLFCSRDAQLEAVYGIAAWLRERGDEVSVDHILPLSKGGKHEYANLQILSISENSQKGSRLPNEQELERIKALRDTIEWIGSPRPKQRLTDEEHLNLALVRSRNWFRNYQEKVSWGLEHHCAK